MILRTLLVAAIVMPSLANAELFKCSVNGKVSYQDRPCAENAKEMEPPKIIGAASPGRGSVLEGLETKCSLDKIKGDWARIPNSSIAFICGKYAGVSEDELVSEFGQGLVEKDADNPDIKRIRYRSEHNDIISLAISSEQDGVISATIVPSEQRKKKIEEKIASEAQQKERMRILTAIGLKKVLIGMTKDNVRLSWGNPTKINRSSRGLEQWVYRRGNSSQYVYFDNGKVSAWN